MTTLFYNPDRKNRKQLIDEFVVRTNIFNEIFADLKTSKAKYPEQNYLLVGQRGLGKTTLLTRLKYAIEDDVALKEQLVPVSFSEEQYNISTLANLWEEVALYLDDYNGFSGVYEDMYKHMDKNNYEQLAFETLIKHLDSSKKKVVLLIDNIGTMLGKFEELEVRRFREILQTRSHVRIIGGSTTSFESISDYHQPLYEFFKVIPLKGLTYEESILLLKKLADVHNETERIEKIIADTPGRVETIRTLSGGVPRTMAMLFNVFLDNEHGSSVSDLEKILDLVTPLYKHRMDDLPVQQQKIVDAVARNWDAISVKELTDRLRLESKLISAQLRQLEKNQVIEKRTTDTKNHLYLLSERFFNIWYLMRYGRKENRQRVIWLVKFLEVWCDQKEIECRINNYIAKIKTGGLDDETSMIYGQIYSFFEKINSDTKFSLKQAAPKHISQDITITEKDVDELIDNAIQTGDWERLIDICLVANKLNTAQKEKIFFLLDEKKEYAVAYINYFARITSNDREKNIGLIEINDFFVVGNLMFIVNGIVNALWSQKEDAIQEGINFFLLFYSKTDPDDDFADFLFFAFIHRLLGFKMYNQSLNIFEQLANKENDLYGRHKIIYNVLLKFLNKKDEIEKLSVEILEKVDEISLVISASQQTIEKERAKIKAMEGKG